jgi:hypothetical protein
MANKVKRKTRFNIRQCLRLKYLRMFFASHDFNASEPFATCTTPVKQHIYGSIFRKVIDMQPRLQMGSSNYRKPGGKQAHEGSMSLPVSPFACCQRSECDHHKKKTFESL